jgi:hypothetical protein
MWRAVTEEACNTLRKVRPEWNGRPIWADRPYSVYLKTVADVWRVVKYIEGNPKKHGSDERAWEFVKRYDEWPFHKKGRGPR